MREIINRASFLQIVVFSLQTDGSGSASSDKRKAHLVVRGMLHRVYVQRKTGNKSVLLVIKEKKCSYSNLPLSSEKLRNI